MSDPRLARGFDPSCQLTTPGGVLRGVGERVFPNGTIAVPGRVKDTFVVEVNPRLSHKITSAILAIIVQEVGYDVSFYEVPESPYVSERLSTVGRGVCTPTHLNAEVWSTSALSENLDVYSNDTTSATVGYNAQYERSIWRDFVQSDDLINFYSVQNTLNLSRVSKPEFCPDGTLGCKNGCSKNDACTAAEAAGRPCILVAMMAFNNDPGYFQAMVSNNNIPAYFCFAGYDGVNQYVLDSMKQNRTIIFYHYQPDLFHHENNRLFTRITFPRGETADVAPSTGDYGELGYGNKTMNPVNGATTTFALRSVILLLGTIIVISLMIAPKLHRLRKTIGSSPTTNDTTTYAGTNNVSSHATSEHTDANCPPKITTACLVVSFLCIEYAQLGGFAH
ncbi:hypothetical protein AC1031_003659 [Aphanomyces cochlioides]|nr:hypothetical protein AC1031_003659 [Aphanomyces cochlioides]